MNNLQACVLAVILHFGGLWLIWTVDHKICLGVFLLGVSRAIMQQLKAVPAVPLPPDDDDLTPA